MKYDCKENDASIELHNDELWISIDGDSKCGKTIIGLKDLNQALNLFGVSNCNIIDMEQLTQMESEYVKNSHKRTYTKEEKDFYKGMAQGIRNVKTLL